MTEEVSLRDYFETCLKHIEDKIDAQGRYIALHFELNEQAIKKAETSMSSKLEGMNEFRNQLREERANLVSKEVVSSIEKRLGALETEGGRAGGKSSGISSTVAAIVTIILVTATIVNVIISLVR